MRPDMQVRLADDEAIPAPPAADFGVELTMRITERWVTLRDLRTFLEKAEALGFDDSTDVRASSTHAGDAALVDILVVTR